MIGVPEFRASLHEADFRHGQAQVMEPLGIRAGWNQAHGRHAPLAFIQRTGQPFRDILPIWRIHPAHALPRLRQPVSLAGVVARTLGVLWRCGHVEREPELTVERVIHLWRGRPFHGVAFESGVEVGHKIKKANKAMTALRRLWIGQEFLVGQSWLILGVRRIIDHAGHVFCDVVAVVDVFSALLAYPDGAASSGVDFVAVDVPHPRKRMAAKDTTNQTAHPTAGSVFFHGV